MNRLSLEDINYLLAVLEVPIEIRKGLEGLKEKGGMLAPEDADVLRDLCGERLQIYGFGPDYAPTLEGLRLERLIDKLFTGV